MIKVNITYGHVIVPLGVDRDKFVINCFNRERVSVILENGQGVMLDCYVDKSTIRDLIFPASSNNLGSYVCVLQQKGKKGVIIGTVSYENESQRLKENDIRLEKFDKSGNISGIRGNATDGNLAINCINKINSAIININVIGKDDSGTLNINTNNQVNITSTNSVNVSSFGEVSIKSLNKDTKDEFTEINIKKDEIYISSKGAINVVSESTIDFNNGNLTIEP